MKSNRAFIVEDETIVSMHLRTILSDLGWEVVGTASSSTEALERIANDPPDLVLMDVRIPGDKDGIEVADDLRRRHGLHCVFVTAYADEGTVRRAQEVGALGYLVKPFTRQEVGAVLATALGQRRELLRLHSRSRSLQSVLDYGEHAVLVLDEASSIVGFNQHAALLTGWTSQEVLERDVREVVRFEATSGRAEDATGDILEAASNATVSGVTLVARDGRTRRVEVDVVPLRDADGDASGSFVLLRRAPGTGAGEAGAVRVAASTDVPRFHELVGDSLAMRRVFEQILELSTVDWNALIEGETGTGKELVARAIHASSRRRNGPFVAVNCAGLTESLLASQLFGHRKGSFTGAVRDQEGLFETAHGGTLFLDEVGDVAPGVQRVLLRVLEEKRITRLGDTRPRDVDVRLVAASQHDLSDEVRKNRFRADLLFRLRVARIKLPALCERRGDIALLANWFLQQSRKTAGKSIRGFTAETLRRLEIYAWPGNVRELRSAVDYAVLACRGAAVEVKDLPPEIAAFGAEDTGAENGGSGAAQVRHIDQRIMAALREAGGNRTLAARLVGISRATLYRRLSEMLPTQPSPDEEGPAERAED